MLNISWKKKIFSSTYQIYQEDELIGEMQRHFLFSKSTTARIEENVYSFEPQNWSSSKFHIRKNKSDKPFAKIKFEGLKTKARIELDEKTYTWNYKSLWQDKWQISDGEKTVIDLPRFKPGKGSIKISEDQLELFLLGLFVSDYFIKIGVYLVTIVIVLVIIS